MEHEQSLADPLVKKADLLLDQIDSLRVLRANSDEEKGRLLEQIGGRGIVEQEMVAQMSRGAVLAHPDRFEEAHHLMMHGVEVLDRNGPRQAKMPSLGPLKPVAEWLVQQGTRFIVKSYISRLMGRICGMYERRESASDWGSREHSMLRRARLDARRVHAGMGGKALGLPTFLLGGAFLSAIASGLQTITRSALSRTWGVVTLAVLLTLLLGGLSWAALYSAAVARRRIRLSTDQPVKALWETVGAAGRPPRDDSYNFAVYAIVLLILSWIVVPLGVWLAIRA